MYMDEMSKIRANLFKLGFRDGKKGLDPSRELKAYKEGYKQGKKIYDNLYKKPTRG